MLREKGTKLRARKKSEKKSRSLDSQKARIFPKDFLFGSATAATQVDGGDRFSDWAEFAAIPGAIKDGASPVIACEHWKRYKSDFALMRRLGHNAYRLSVDWSRLQGQPGQFDHAALDHFRGMLQCLRGHGIRPLLTLHHFALPAWWLKKGGWEKEENIQDFLRYVDFITSGVVDLVDEFVTLNEPNVYPLMSYMMGLWPPGHHGFTGYHKSMHVLRNMLLAHFRAYDLIRDIYARAGKKEPVVGVAMHYRIVEPARAESMLDRNRAAFADRRFNQIWPDSLHSGRLLAPMGKGEKVHDGKAWDFAGINYYSREMVAFAMSPENLFMRVFPRPGAELNSLGWEIYPEGLYRALHHYYGRYGLPIRITENGIAGSDEQRQAFLSSHLQMLGKALSEGLPIQGYYHWSFMDNFEWAEGCTARFGLVEVDFATQKRRPRASAHLYKKIIESGRIPPGR